MSERVRVDVPVVATLDRHAHVTAEMVAHAEALVAWETHPHRDAFITDAYQRFDEEVLATFR